MIEISVYEVSDHCDQHGSEKTSLGCEKCLTLACAHCEPGACGRLGRCLGWSCTPCMGPKAGTLVVVGMEGGGVKRGSVALLR